MVVNMIKTGHVIELPSIKQKAREKIGLSAKPPTSYQFEEALSEIQSLIKSNRLDSKVAWNWDKKRAEY